MQSTGSPLFHLLRFVPKNHISHFCGILSQIRWPCPVQQAILRRFSEVYGADLSECEHDVSSYRSLCEFFTRNLKPGARPIGQGIVSPVDGALSDFGRLEPGTVLRVKGRQLSCADLLRDEALADRFREGAYLNFYLAPGDYHHIHSPVSGIIREAVLVEGKLWPVNSWSVEHIARLYAVNERIITVIESAEAGSVCVIKVGATNVGSIRLSYDDELCGNRGLGLGRRTAVRKKHYQDGIAVEAGERIGTFCLGSTVVLLFQQGRFEPGENCRPGRIRMGTSLGRPGAAAEGR